VNFRHKARARQAAQTPAGLACAIGFLLMSGDPILAAESHRPKQYVEIAPDRTVQSSIAALATAADDFALARQVQSLVMTRGGNDADLIAQLLWYAAENPPPEKSRALIGNVLRRLDLSRQALVAALSPHLDSRNATIQQMVRDLLRSYEDRSASRPPDFSAYRAIIEADVRAGYAPQRSLVVFMYESDPGTALLTMLRAYQLRDPEQIKPILWAEHLVADLFWRRRFGFVASTAVDAAAIQQLEKLSQHDRWWVRLYVMAVVSAHPELGSPELTARLRRDRNALVREW